ncbi:MAG: hypothetical protein HY708_04060 [Ignavibacteriae bacterium]|nr:hypothetical protein [Ignavibacteriota bacterium]
MKRKSSGDVPSLLDRVTGESDSWKERERRYIYSGEPRTTPGYVIRPNRKATRRKVSTFTIILMLFGFAVSIVVYIGNIIEVDRLAIEVHQLRTIHSKIVDANEALKAEINRKSSLERIAKTATEELGLRYSTVPPILIDVGRDQFERFGKR